MGEGCWSGYCLVNWWHFSVWEARQRRVLGFFAAGHWGVTFVLAKLRGLTEFCGDWGTWTEFAWWYYPLLLTTLLRGEQGIFREWSEDFHVNSDSILDILRLMIGRLVGLPKERSLWEFLFFFFLVWREKKGLIGTSRIKIRFVPNMIMNSTWREVLYY